MKDQDRLPDEATVFQVELPNGYQIGHVRTEQDRYIKLFFIFQSCNSSLKQQYSIVIVSKGMINALNLVRGKVDRVEIAWIKVHVGHPGNESRHASQRSGPIDTLH